MTDVLANEGDETEERRELLSCLRQGPALYLGQLVGTDSNTRVCEEMTEAIELRLIVEELSSLTPIEQLEWLLRIRKEKESVKLE